MPAAASPPHDDLKRIRGIGPDMEKALNEMRIRRYSDIANLSSALIEEIGKLLGPEFKARLARENWIEQAQILAKGGETSYSRRYDRGEIAGIIAAFVSLSAAALAQTSAPSPVAAAPVSVLAPHRSELLSAAHSPSPLVAAARDWYERRADAASERSRALGPQHPAAKRQASRASDRTRRAEPLIDTVDCSLFAPSEVAPKETFLIQVLLHTPAQRTDAIDVAVAKDERASRRGFATLEVPIARGATVEFHLDCPQLISDGPAAAWLPVTWNGEPAGAAFAVRLPADAKPGTIKGRLHARVDRIARGVIEFELHVGAVAAASEPSGRIMGATALASTPAAPSSKAAQIIGVGTRSQRNERAFVSYSRRDFRDAAMFARALERARIECFMDVNSIKPGAEWAKSLEEAIDRADVFYLLWSSKAARSKEVMKEVLYAHERRSGPGAGLPMIDPVPLHRRLPPVPDFLKHLHFDEVWLAHLEAQRRELFRERWGWLSWLIGR